MKAVTWAFFPLCVLLIGGCVRPDWIEATLVTADVSGTWRGTAMATTGGISLSVEMMLEQRGARVTGRVGTTPLGRLSGPVEGTVSGDVFRFSQTGGLLNGEATIDGDEMNGEVRGSPHGAAGRWRISLRR
jgi:hypothetical protein